MADSTPHGPSIAFGRIAAAIPVSDISRALGFYQDILGMTVTFTNGEPVGFVILRRDAAELHLTLVKGHKGGSHNAAHLMVADAVGLRTVPAVSPHAAFPAQAVMALAVRRCRGLGGRRVAAPGHSGMACWPFI